MALVFVHDGPKMAQDGLKMAQKSPNTLQDSCKMPPRGPKLALRWLQDWPNRLDGAKSAQKWPLEASLGLIMAPWWRMRHQDGTGGYSILIT